MVPFHRVVAASIGCQ